MTTKGGPGPGLAQVQRDALPTRTTPSKALAEARTRARLNQRELAEKMGVNKSVVCRMESGEHDVQLISLQKAAQALGVRFVVLVDADGCSAKVAKSRKRAEP